METAITLFPVIFFLAQLLAPIAIIVAIILIIRKILKRRSERLRHEN